MKKFNLFILIISFSFGIMFSQTAGDILKRVEDRMMGKDAPKDFYATMIMTINKNSSKKERELIAWSKNFLDKSDWKVMKFKKPADVKGIGFLTLSDEKMYLYLPEFHRIRRIASSNKKDSFVGSDFSYDDLGETEFSKNYIPKISKQDEKFIYLELKRKSGIKKPYLKIELKIDKKVLLPVEMKFYDNSSKLWKIAEQKFKKIGKYFVINYIKMKDLKKNSFTTLEMKNIEVDKGLKDTIFTKRFLKKRVK